MTALTAIRFFAALWVVCYHFRDQLSFDIDRFTPLFKQRPVGVDFFFILSGFVLAHVYADDVCARRFDYRRFLHKRIARIYPLHIATLGVLVAFALLLMAAHIAPRGTTKYDWSQIPLHLTMTHAWGLTDHLSWNIPSWSISAEFAAYLLFPLLTLAQFRLPPRWGLPLAIALLTSTWMFTQMVLGRDLTGFQYDGVVRILPEFFLGLALWRVRGGARPIYFWVTLAVMLVAIQLGAPRYAIVAALAVLVWSGSALSAPRWLVLLGEASYSLYMIHALTQTFGFGALDHIWPHRGAMASLLAVIGVIAVTVLLSIASYAWFEKPARAWLTRDRRAAKLTAPS